jgi:hypothetical protein
MESSAAYLLIDLPLAVASFWLAWNHDGAIEFLKLVWTGEANAVYYYAFTIYIGLALLRHIWHSVRSLLRMPKPVRRGILLWFWVVLVSVAFTTAAL